ncbi:hypothetical protein F4808DRAFT_99530 [Astrocystis sublimbata]|nr:hypothetical protein F4808DRAFT_99530 [Astrocystis sublimbata]
MVLLPRTGATALASLVALSSVANAQGFYYQDTRLQCGPQYNYQYLGCAAVSTQPFGLMPQRYIPDEDLSRSNIHYDTGDFVNMTGTPFFCSEFCRSSGAKYALLWDKRCICANTLVYNKADDGSSVNLQQAIDPNSDTLCLTDANGNNYPPCGGDRRENCGSNRGARVFVDPSFPDERTLAAPATLAADYGALGCFRKTRFPSGDESVTTVTVTSAPRCFSYCADLGMPYLFMESVDGGNNIKCNCGSEFNKRTAQATFDLDRCTLKCDNIADTTTPCQGQNCCSTGNGPYTVYANPKLMGCFIPIIPGAADPPTVEDPAPNGYDCFPTPQSIRARAASPVISYASRTMSASASFIATASPAANAYVNYGCFQDTPVSSLFSTPVPYSGADSAALDVDKCVAFCDQGGYDFAGVWGIPTQCSCGSGISSSAVANDAMEICNQPCTGSLRQNCGGDRGPIVYARASISPNRWASSYSATYAKTLIYSCTTTSGELWRMFLENALAANTDLFE